MKRLYLLLIIAFMISSLFGQEKDLNYFISKALENSPLIKDYDNQIRSNKIDSMKINAGFGPQVTAVSNNYYAPVIKGWGYDEIVTDKANLTAQVALTKEFVSRQNRENQLRALQIGNLSIRNTRKISEQELTREVTAQYIRTFGSFQEFNFTNEIMVLLRNEEKILKKLTEGNVYRQTDYLTFLLAVQKQEFELARAGSKLRTNFATLNYLCGIEDTSTFSVPDPGLVVSGLPDPKNNIFYQSFINDSLLLTVEDKQIDFAYKPKVIFFTDAGYLSSLYYQPWKNIGASAGINLSVPIYDGQQKKMKHQQIYLSEQTRQSYSTFYLKQYSQQISILLNQLNDNDILGELLGKQILYSRTLVEANHKLLETGDVQMTDYVLAINNYLYLKNAIFQNIVERYDLVNQINYWNRTK
jgi:hypothetical protein